MSPSSIRSDVLESDLEFYRIAPAQRKISKPSSQSKLPSSISEEESEKLAKGDSKEGTSSLNLPTSLNHLRQINDDELIHKDMQETKEVLHESEEEEEEEDCLENVSAAPCPHWAKFGLKTLRFLLRVAGVLPCGSEWRLQDVAWRNLLSLLHLVFLLDVLCQLFNPAWRCKLEGNPCHGGHGLLVDVAVGVGSFLMLPSLGVRVSTLNGVLRNTQALSKMAEARFFEVAWAKQSCKDLVLCVMAWLLIVGSRALVDLSKYDSESWALSLFRLILFAVCTGVMAASTLAFLFWCHGLRELVDSFLLALALRQSFRRSARSWKVRAALMRRICCGLQACFSVLVCTVELMIFMACIELANGTTWYVLLPIAAIVLYLPAVLLRAGAVTSVCNKVPPVVSSLTGYKELDEASMQFVQFVQSTKAGIYIYDTLFDYGVAVRLMYLTAVVVFSISSNRIDLRALRSG